MEHKKVLSGCIENGDTLQWKCKLTKPIPMTLMYSAQVDKNQKLQGNIIGSIMGKTVMNSAALGVPVMGEKADAAKAESNQLTETESEKKGLFAKIFG